MCKGSRVANVTKTAAQNTAFGIGTIGVHGSSGNQIGALHAPGSTTAECVHCIETGQKLTLRGIPATLQAQFGIGEIAVATFQESDHFHSDDLLNFGGGKRINLGVFADQGIVAYTGVLPETSKVVDELKTSAIAEGKGLGATAGVQETGGAPARVRETV